jgi:hypothetical protein
MTLNILTRAKQALMRILGTKPQPNPPVRILRVHAWTDGFGQTRFYPACKLAQHFADIAKTKTLTDHTLSHILRLGYLVQLDSERGPEFGTFI